MGVSSIVCNEYGSLCALGQRSEQIDSKHFTLRCGRVLMTGVCVDTAKLKDAKQAIVTT